MKIPSQGSHTASESRSEAHPGGAGNMSSDLPTVTERILDASPDLIIAWDVPAGRVLFANAPARALLGDLSRAVPRPDRLPLEDSVHADDLPALRMLIGHIAAAHDGEACEAEFRVSVAPHILRWLRCRGVALLRGHGGTPEQVLLIAQDVTERRDADRMLAENARAYHRLAQRLAGQQAELERRNAHLAELAITDGLTGLLNHVGFQERLEDEFRVARQRGRPACLLLLDVDHFKMLNDTFGHPAGDQALRSVARCLRDQSRAGDAIARYGGEEFAVILPDTAPAEARLAAERLRRAVREITDTPQRLSISIGIAPLSDCYPDRAALIAAADRALYAAKRQGRDCAVVVAE